MRVSNAMDDNQYFPLQFKPKVSLMNLQYKETIDPKRLNMAWSIVTVTHYTDATLALVLAASFSTNTSWSKTAPFSIR